VEPLPASPLGTQGSAVTAGSTVVPGTADYDRHVRGEIELYSKLFATEAAREQLLEPAPASWLEAESRAAALIRDATGADMVEHVVRRLRARPETRLLSLGSGPGGLEIGFAQQAPQSRIFCLDLNKNLMALGRDRAQELSLNVTFEAADLNVVELPAGEFDVVFCHAALHHLVNLEHVASQIGRCLREHGEFIVVDVITPNRYRMWRENERAVVPLFRSLPARFRVNHTAYATPTVDDEIWRGDTDDGSMECIRSEDVLPVIETYLDRHAFVPYYSICRRFLDSMYGPNFDLSRPLDCALFNWLWEFDVHSLRNLELEPETFFGIYGRRSSTG
jgi:SAM-dependent methyltransferase